MTIRSRVAARILLFEDRDLTDASDTARH